MRRQKQKNKIQIISRASGQILDSMDVVEGRGGMSEYFLFVVCIFSMASFLSSVAFAGGVKGKVTIVGGMDNANAVIYIEKVDSTFVPPDTVAIMDQKHLAFIPEVLPILAGTTVKFLNSDEVLHNVFTPSSCAGGFNLGSFPPGESKTYTFKKEGCAALILCDVHPEMQAWVVALQNPYFAVSDSEGNYAIKGIPAGTYILKAWYGYYEAGTAKIIVTEEGTVNIDFRVRQ
jgi:plastocyanin